jgi:hypothetical protein
MLKESSTLGCLSPISTSQFLFKKLECKQQIQENFAFKLIKYIFPLGFGMNFWQVGWRGCCSKRRIHSIHSNKQQLGFHSREQEGVSGYVELFFLGQNVAKVGIIHRNM